MKYQYYGGWGREPQKQKKVADLLLTYYLLSPHIEKNKQNISQNKATVLNSAGSQVFRLRLFCWSSVTSGKGE